LKNAGGSLKRSLGMAYDAFPIPKAFGFEAATRRDFAYHRDTRFASYVIASEAKQSQLFANRRLPRPDSLASQ